MVREPSREAAGTPTNYEFGAALALARSSIRQAQTHCVLARSAVEERFPGASALAANEPADAGLPRSDAPERSFGSRPDALLQEWEDLRKCFAAIRAVHTGPTAARTVDYLDPVGRWQQQATRVREHEAAAALDLMPPVNDGASLDAFVTRLLAEFPALDARFREHVVGGQ